MFRRSGFLFILCGRTEDYSVQAHGPDQVISLLGDQARA